VNQISKISQELIVIFVCKVFPIKLRVTGLRTIDDQVVTPYFTGNILLELDCVVTKYTCSMSLAELSSFIVEILSCRDVMKKSPTLLGCNQGGGEDHCVERNVIFTHELIEPDIFVLPPFFVIFLKKIGSNRDISNRSIEPDIKNFVLELLDGNRDTPFEIPGDALGPEAHVDPSICDMNGVWRPYFRCFVDPCLQLSNDFRKFYEQMGGFLDNRFIFANVTPVVDQFSRGVVELSALITLVSSGLIILTKGAIPNDKSISQKQTTMFAVTLSH